MMRWAEDPGGPTSRSLRCSASPRWRSSAGRPVAAALAVAVGLFVHETGFVFGLPLLAGLWLDQGRWRAIGRRAAFGVGAVLGLALLLYLAFDGLPRSDARTMVDVVRSHLPPHEYVDWAIYFAVSGARGVQTSLCQNAGDPTYGLHVGGGLLVIGLFVAILKRARRTRLAGGAAGVGAAVPLPQRDRERHLALGRACCVQRLAAVRRRAGPRCGPPADRGVLPCRLPAAAPSRREDVGLARRPAGAGDSR
jgi:MFS family permease